LLPSGEECWIDVTLFRQAYVGKKRKCQIAALALAHLQQATRPHQDILKCREVRKKIELLKDHADAAPLTAFAACELRSARPFSPDGFREFNQGYAQVLRSWGIMEGDDNPVARSNVCPELDPPTESCFYAFTYAIPDASTGPSFLISGGAETRSGPTKPEDRIIAFGDTSTDGLRRKARQTIGEMERRLTALGFSWAHTTAVQVDTIHDFHPFFFDEIVARGVTSKGLTWHPCRPPVQMVEFEVDCRGIHHEIVLGTHDRS
jgi:hypothetical protein